MIKPNLEAGFASLCHNPLRAILTVSGIVVGIAAVVAVLAIGKGNEATIEQHVQQMGASLFWIEMRIPASQSGIPQVSQASYPVAPYAQALTTNDADKIASRCNLVEWSSPFITTHMTGSVNGKQTQLKVVAVNSRYHKVRSLKIMNGRFFSDLENIQQREVCVAEKSIQGRSSEEHEGFADVGGLRFKIVGTVKPEDRTVVPDQAQTIYVPITVFQQRLAGSKTIHTIYCKARDASVDEARRQVEKVLASKVKHTLQVRSPRDLFQRAEDMSRTATLVTAGIGMLSLFVGGIGIMNILLASVAERTREIGIRKAVGAKRKDILIQFLFESILFSLIGGAVGLGFGIVSSNLLGSLLRIPSLISAEAIVVGVVFSLVVGVIFGVYPAWKASRLSPIEALRYE
jgi:putative ABC transport system permease protein